jgi:hypothetical protein
MPVAMESSFTCRARSHSQAWFGYYTQVGTSLEVHRHLVELESTFSGQPGRHSGTNAAHVPCKAGCWHQDDGMLASLAADGAGTTFG